MPRRPIVSRSSPWPAGRTSNALAKAFEPSARESAVDSGARHPGKRRGLVCTGVGDDTARRFRFGSANQATVPVATMCRVLGVSESGLRVAGADAVCADPAGYRDTSGDSCRDSTGPSEVAAQSYGAAARARLTWPGEEGIDRAQRCHGRTTKQDIRHRGQLNVRGRQRRQRPNPKGRRRSANNALCACLRIRSGSSGQTRIESHPRSGCDHVLDRWSGSCAQRFRLRSLPAARRPSLTGRSMHCTVKSNSTEREQNRARVRGRDLRGRRVRSVPWYRFGVS